MQLKKYLYFLAAVIFLCSACTSEKKTVNKSKEAVPEAAKASEVVNADGSEALSLELSPREATRKTLLSVGPKGFKLTDATFQWLVNGMLVVSPQPYQLSAAEFPRKCTIQAKAIVRGRELLSNIVEVGNTPPEITRMQLLPLVFHPGDTLSVDYTAADIDEDKVTFSVEWTVNGVVVSKTSKLEGTVKRGDNVMVQVTPFDGESYGVPSVIERDIQNMPPTFVEHPDFSFDGKTYAYQARAIDPDGDPLTYSLASTSDGVSIDSSTGVLTWFVPADFKGTRTVTIIADDGHGGTARYTLNMTINESP